MAQVNVDRALIAPNVGDAAFVSIVPNGLTMTGAEAADASILAVLQSYSFTIVYVGRITEGMNVIYEKVDKYDALAAQLMADTHFLGAYELPFIPSVDFSENEPNNQRYTLVIEFTVRAANWRYGGP